jgi:hypothetical protein
MTDPKCTHALDEVCWSERDTYDSNGNLVAKRAILVCTHKTNPPAPSQDERDAEEYAKTQAGWKVPQEWIQDWFLAGRKGMVPASEVERVKEVLKHIVDEEPCRFDHKGGCQAHGFIFLEPGEICPQAEAKSLLTPKEGEAG